MKEESKVQVWLNKDTYLGEGTLTGSATMMEAYQDIYGIQDEEEILKKYISNAISFSERMFKKKAPQEAIDKFASEARNNLSHCTPKIILDSGKTVYGCQIWWSKKK
jgi:hypothetical protein